MTVGAIGHVNAHGYLYKIDQEIVPAVVMVLRPTDAGKVERQGGPTNELDPAVIPIPTVGMVPSEFLAEDVPRLLGRFMVHAYGARH